MALVYWVFKFQDNCEDYVSQLEGHIRHVKLVDLDFPWLKTMINHRGATAKKIHNFVSIVLNDTKYHIPAVV